jgi:hypothetical protein
MVHTVRIDDATTAGKRFMKEFSHTHKGIEFENPAVTGIVPDGYMTSNEFWKVVREDTKKFCSEHGIL